MMIFPFAADASMILLNVCDTGMSLVSNKTYVQIPGMIFMSFMNMYTRPSELRNERFLECINGREDEEIIQELSLCTSLYSTAESIAAYPDLLSPHSPLSWTPDSNLLSVVSIVYRHCNIVAVASSLNINDYYVNHSLAMLDYCCSIEG